MRVTHFGCVALALYQKIEKKALESVAMEMEAYAKCADLMFAS